MKFLDKIEPLLLLTAVAFGLILQTSSFISHMAKVFISPFLIFMLFGLFWEAPLKDIRKSFSNVKFTVTALAINFIWTPIFAWILVMLFMGYSPLLGLGFIMLLVTPCTDWYLVFTGMAKGNLNLSISILPVNLLLQMILLPVYILIFSGKAVDINMFLVGKSMLLTLIIPFALAKLLKLLFAKYHGDTGLLENLIIKRQFFWLWLSITMMFASEKIIGEGYLMIFLIILIPTTLFFLVNFYLGRFVSSQMGFSKENSVSLIFTTLARNSPLSLAFAQLAFPADRQVLLPLIIGPLIELPILALMAQAILVVFNDQGKKTRKEY